MIRLGLIGTGGRAYLAKHMHRPDLGVAVTAGADILENALERFKDDYGPDVRTEKDYRHLLDDDRVDAVAVFAPDYLHEEMAVNAFDAGKHVYLEKPMAISTAGCDRILDAWRRSGRKMMVGFNLRHHPVYRTMKAIADSGDLGEIRNVWMRHFVGLGGEFYFHDWHASKNNTNSLLLQKGSHDIDLIHWITGRYARTVWAIGGLDHFGGNRPDDLTCPKCPDRDTCAEFQTPVQHPERIRCALRREVNVEDNAMVFMDLGDGVRACYLQNHFTPDYQRNYVFIGERGRMENNEENETVHVRMRSTRDVAGLSDRLVTIKPSQGDHGGADPVIALDFIKMLTEGREPVSTPEAGRMAVAVGCAATESMRNGGIPVKVPPLE